MRPLQTALKCQERLLNPDGAPRSDLPNEKIHEHATENRQDDQLPQNPRYYQIYGL